MSAGIRRAAVVATLVLVLLVGGVLAAGTGSSRATADRGPDGLAALAGVLQRMGHRLEPLRLGLHVLSRKDPGLLFIVSPPGLLAWPALTEADGTRLVEWVARGGTVILAQDRPSPLLLEVGVDIDPLGLPRSVEGTRPAVAARPGSWTLHSPLSIEGRATLDVDPGFSPLYAVHGEVVAAERALGAGRIVVLADPSVLGNSALGRGGNLEFVAAVAHAALGASGVVYFDDLHAGGGDAHGVVAYARRAGGGPALLLLAALVLLGLWRLGAREASAVRPRPNPPMLGGAEHVRALAGLYERADLGRHALDVTSRRFRRAVESRAGIPWELDRLDRWLDEELGPAAARDFARVRAAFGHLFSVEEPETEAVLATARLAARFEARWLARRGGERGGV